jgi:hypothetical protein
MLMEKMTVSLGISRTLLLRDDLMPYECDITERISINFFRVAPLNVLALV